MSLQLRFVSHSEVGLVRKNNQDSGYASPQLLVVADGMGGAAAGDLASAVAIDTDQGPGLDPSTGASTGALLSSSKGSGTNRGPATDSGTRGARATCRPPSDGPTTGSPT